MRRRGRARSFTRYVLLALVLVGVLVLPAAAADKESGPPPKLLEQLSGAITTTWLATHPDQSPYGRALNQVVKARGKGPKGNTQKFCESRSRNDVFNCDTFGLPQNEESITACTANTDYVLGGTNDYRGLIDPVVNFTGWHWSIDGGRSVKNEGLLPPVHLITDPNHQVPSGGDPVDFLYADSTGCHAFAASLAYDPVDPFGKPNGVAVYRTEPSTLSSCPGGSDPSCWPTRRLIVESGPAHFLDKEWFFVGDQGGTPYVWVTYSDFDLAPSDPNHPFEASVKAVRCNITLTTCTAPIPISTVDEDIQFSDVTIGPDGRAYITWSRIDGELEGTDQTFTHKIRVETAPGSAAFGPEHVIYAEDRAIPFGGFLQANDFRIATYAKSDVAWVSGHSRVFVIWDACKVRLLGTVCEFPEIKLSYSDDTGATWKGPYVISKGGVNYFPSISVDSADASNKKASVAWFTNSFDSAFWNEQDVVQGSIETGKSSYGPEGTTRLTQPSNETEADPLLGGFFIGDYIEVAQVNNRAYTHYNANYRQIPLLGPFGPPFSESPPVNQQDNYLSVKGVG
jgi:hypothetical protein